MIKINLAKRRLSMPTPGEVGGKKSFQFNAAALKELPIRRFAVLAAFLVAANILQNDLKERKLSGLKKKIVLLNEASEKRNARLKKVNGYRSLKEPLEKDEFTIRTKIETIQKLMKDRRSTPMSLLKLTQVIPEEVWIDSIRASGSQVAITGGALNFNQVSDFIQILNDNGVVKEIDLEKSNKTKNSNGVDIALFSLKAKR